MRKSKKQNDQCSIRKFGFDLLSVAGGITVSYIGIMVGYRFSTRRDFPGMGILTVALFVIIVLLIIYLRTGFTFKNKYSLPFKVGAFFFALLVIVFLSDFFLNWGLFVEHTWENKDGEIILTNRNIMFYPFLHVLCSAFFFIMLGMLCIKSKDFKYGWRETSRIIIVYLTLLNVYLLIDRFFRINFFIVPDRSNLGAFSINWSTLKYLIFSIPVAFCQIWEIYIIKDYYKIKPQIDD